MDKGTDWVVTECERDNDVGGVSIKYQVSAYGRGEAKASYTTSTDGHCERVYIRDYDHEGEECDWPSLEEAKAAVKAHYERCLAKHEEREASHA